MLWLGKGLDLSLIPTSEKNRSRTSQSHRCIVAQSSQPVVMVKYHWVTVTSFWSPRAPSPFKLPFTEGMKPETRIKGELQVENDAQTIALTVLHSVQSKNYDNNKPGYQYNLYPNTALAIWGQKQHDNTRSTGNFYFLTTFWWFWWKTIDLVFLLSPVHAPRIWKHLLGPFSWSARRPQRTSWTRLMNMFQLLPNKKTTVSGGLISCLFRTR